MMDGESKRTTCDLDRISLYLYLLVYNIITNKQNVIRAISRIRLIIYDEKRYKNKKYIFFN